MKIAVAGDSAGLELAKALVEYLSSKYDVADMSVPHDGSDELYANMAARIAHSVVAGDYDRAILVCGTGIGVCISANKIRGIRAAQCHDTYSAERAVLSNNAQIMCIGARVVGVEVAKAIASAFLAHSFDETGRSSANVTAINMLDING